MHIRSVTALHSDAYPMRECYLKPRDHFVKARTILAAIWRKKIEAMNERERTMTTNGSLESQLYPA